MKSGIEMVKRRQDGFILIAAMAMLVGLMGVVLICLYPLAYEARQAPRHREALRRFKAAEQGMFGRLADQPGGAYSACGGYFSDTGFKMVVAELVDPYLGVGGNVTRLRRLMEYWFFRRFSADRVGVGKNEGCDDIYRYDRESGFWVGYRGKRYLVRPAGEEHRRQTYFINTLNESNPEDYLDFETDPDLPIFTDGYHGKLELGGETQSKTFFLSGAYNLDFVEVWGSLDQRPYEHRRYFNPVEKLIVRVRDRRDIQTPLSAVLVYAKQPDSNPLGDIDDRLPLLSPQVVTETPGRTERIDDITSFVFLWDHDRAIPGDDNSPPNNCVGHTFQIGLKKLVILENGIPAFACGITIPPVREYQCRETQSGRDMSAGCRQPYYDQYVVEVDYEG